MELSGCKTTQIIIQIIKLLPCGSRTTFLALLVRTPSIHSLVSMSICPRSCCLGMAFGFIIYCLTWKKIYTSLCSNLTGCSRSECIFDIYAPYRKSSAMAEQRHTHHSAHPDESSSQHPPEGRFPCSTGPDNDYTHALSQLLMQLQSLFQLQKKIGEKKKNNLTYLNFKQRLKKTS